MSYSILEPVPSIIGCEVDNISDNPKVTSGQQSDCLACQDKYLGNARVTLDSEGAVQVIAGRCIKYAIEAAPAGPRPLDFAA